MADEKVHESDAELIEEVALTRQVLPFTMADLAAREDGGVILERGIKNFTTLRNASIALTEPQDWTLYKIDEGRIRAYLENAGVERVWAMWGPEQYDIGDPVRTDDQETGEFSISMTGSCLSKRTGFSVERVTATRYSYEPFIVKRKLPKLQVEPEVTRACRASLNGKHGRILMGLNAVPTQELDEVWERAGMKWKTTKLCNLGRGFGTGDERAGGASTAHGIDAADVPECDVCRIQLVWRAGKEGKEGFFGCRNWEKHKETKVIVSLAKAKEIAERKQVGRQQSREPGGEG